MPTDLAPFSLERFMGAAMAMARGGMLPGPKGINVNHLVREDGMRPWLRAGLPEATVQRLEAEGRAGCWLGALLGRDGYHPTRLREEGGRDTAAMVVDCLCEDARLTAACLMFGLRGRVSGEDIERLLPAFVARENDSVWRMSPATNFVEEGLMSVAKVEGIHIPVVETPDLWRNKDVTACVIAVEALGQGALGRRDSRIAVLETKGYGTFRLWEDDVVRWPWRDGEVPRGEVSLILAGVTSGHRGYVQRAQRA